MDDKDFSEGVAKDWIRMIESESARIRDQDIYPLLGRWVTESDPRTILDIGCGQGACSAALGLKGRKYIGLDPSPALVERAQTLYPDREFVVGNAYAIPFRDGSFEAVFSVAVLHLLEHLDSALREMARVLTPSGSFLIITADQDSYPSWNSEGDTLYSRSSDEILNSLVSVGLEISGTQLFRGYFAIQGRKSSAQK